MPKDIMYLWLTILVNTQNKNYFGWYKTVKRDNSGCVSQPLRWFSYIIIQ